MKKILAWGLVIFIAYYLVHNPATAAHSVGSIGHGLEHAAQSLSKVVDSL